MLGILVALGLVGVVTATVCIGGLNMCTGGGGGTGGFCPLPLGEPV